MEVAENRGANRSERGNKGETEGVSERERKRERE